MVPGQKPSALTRFTPSPDLVWTRFEDSDEWVVYHKASANIHLVTASAQRLWTLAGDGQAHSVEELALAISAGHTGDLHQELLDATRDALAFRDDAGLLIPLTA